MYPWIVKRSLYPPPISTDNENLRIGNTKIMGLILPRLWSMLVCKRYTMHLLPSCCDGSDFASHNRPARYMPPRTSPPNY